MTAAVKPRLEQLHLLLVKKNSPAGNPRSQGLPPLPDRNLNGRSRIAQAPLVCAGLISPKSRTPFMDRHLIREHGWHLIVPNSDSFGTRFDLYSSSESLRQNTASLRLKDLVRSERSAHGG